MNRFRGRSGASSAPAHGLASQNYSPDKRVDVRAHSDEDRGSTPLASTFMGKTIWRETPKKYSALRGHFADLSAVLGKLESFGRTGRSIPSSCVTLRAHARLRTLRIFPELRQLPEIPRRLNQHPRGRCLFNEATDCARTHESGDTMTADKHEKVQAAERERFMECPQCGEILSLEELLLHLAHKELRDIPYSEP